MLLSHLTELLQGSIATVETIVQTTDFIVGLLQALNRDTDTNLWDGIEGCKMCIRDRAGIDCQNRSWHRILYSCL